MSLARANHLDAYVEALFTSKPQSAPSQQRTAGKGKSALDETQNDTSIISLPIEMVAKILNHLAYGDILNLRQTCQYFASININILGPNLHFQPATSIDEFKSFHKNCREAFRNLLKSKTLHRGWKTLGKRSPLYQQVISSNINFLTQLLQEGSDQFRISTLNQYSQRSHEYKHMLYSVLRKMHPSAHFLQKLNFDETSLRDYEMMLNVVCAAPNFTIKIASSLREDPNFLNTLVKCKRLYPSIMQFKSKGLTDDMIRQTIIDDIDNVKHAPVRFKNDIALLSQSVKNPNNRKSLVMTRWGYLPESTRLQLKQVIADLEHQEKHERETYLNQLFSNLPGPWIYEGNSTTQQDDVNNSPSPIS